MRKEITILSVGAALFLNACGDDEATPEILSFETSAASVSRGRPVNLTWKVINADHVKLIGAPDEVLVDASSDLEGSFLTPPITRSRAFTLRAVNGELSVEKTLQITAISAGDPVMIAAFDADPESVAPGGSSTLSWRTQNASGGSVSVQGGDTVLAQADLPNGSFAVTPEFTTTYVFTALGTGGPAEMTRTVAVRRPTVDNFVVNPTSIPVGDSAILAWSVSFSTSVNVDDDHGNDIVTSGTPVGQIMVSPSETTIYTLTASDDAGLTDSAQVTLTVSAPVVAEVVSFDCTPAAVDIGVASQLTWVTTGARNGITIEAANAVVHRSSLPTGTVDVYPAETTTYELTADGPGGDDSASVVVTVNPSPPAVMEFLATPNPLVLGDTTTLSWLTLGATSIDVRQGSTSIFASSTDVDSGLFVVPVSSATTAFSIVATNTLGSSTDQLTVTAYDPPSIQSFTADPLTFNGMATINIDWSTSNADAVELLRSGVTDPNFNTQMLSGSYQVQISQTTFFELVASNPAASTAATVLVADTVGQVEPNDDPASAVRLPAGGGTTTGEISPVGDEDWIRVSVVEGGSVRAQTSDGSGGCAMDTLVELYAPGGTTKLGENEDSSGACSLIDPQVETWAHDLPSGDYYVRVVAGASGGTGPYSLSVVAAAPSCGNGIREIRDGEQCDEGPSNGGGFCTTMCVRDVTIDGTVTGVGQSTFNGSINPATDADFFQIDISADTYLMARTYAPAEPTCTADTLVRLHDSDFTIVGENDQSGADSCSIIHPAVHPFALLTSGTYYLSVESARGLSVIGGYQLNITTVAPGCGNTVLETSETCDDGNTTPNDGCDGSCQFEGVLETEPNDQRMAADPMGNSTSASGRIDPVGDTDWYSIAVPDGYSLRVSTRDGAGTCMAEIGTVDTEISLYAGDGTFLGSDDDGGLETCSLIDPVESAFAQILSAGTYYVSVEQFNHAGTGPYQVDIEPLVPECGNRIVEPAIGDQCDDGNNDTGDGCDATCQVEIIGTLDSATTSTRTFDIPLPGPLTYGTVQVTIALANESISATTQDAGGGGACMIDTALELLDSNFDLLVRTEDGSTGGCAAIPFPSAGASNLAPGTYYVQVLNQGSSSGTSELAITIEPPP